jgi:hypothetical protein
MLSTCLKALVVHRPEALPLADNVKFIENGRQMKLGDGLWKSFDAFHHDGGPQQIFLDVPRGVAGLHMVGLEGNSPVLLVLRIQVVDRKITEIETVVIQGLKEALIFDILHGAKGQMDATPEGSRLNTREEAIQITEQYLDWLKRGNSAGASAPFASDVYRGENGRRTEGPENIRAQLMPRPELAYQIAAVDTDLGLVWIRENSGPSSSSVAWEGLKIYGNQIHAIEGFSRN